MRSCTCIRVPYKYVTEPKKAGDARSEFSGSSKEAQSIVTDSEVFDHEALLKQEGSTDYEEESPNYRRSSTGSSEDSDSYYSRRNSRSYVSSSKKSSKTISKKSSGDLDSEEPQLGSKSIFNDEKFRNTVERWNELLNKFDEEPDLAEVQEVLTMVSKMSEQQDDETSKQVAETIRRLTSSLAEVASMPTEADAEVVLQQYIGEDEETYFKCFVRKLREHAGNKVEIEVNEVVAENIRVLFNSLGLLRRNSSVGGNNMIARMTSSIRGANVFKNLYPNEVGKSSMDLSTYLHHLSEKVGNDDLASVSTLSELDFNYQQNHFSNCLVNTSQCCDDSVCRLITDQNTKIAAFCVEQLKKQAMLRNKYEDLSDQPLFII